MGLVCGMNGGERNALHCFRGRNLNGRDNLEDLGADGSIMLKYNLKQ